MLVAMLDPSTTDQLRPIARAEYDRMVELGMFADERVELLRGMLVTMSRQGWLHMRVISWLTATLVRQLDDTYEIRPQGPFAASDWSEPEPDVAVARKDYTLHDHPSALLLVVEVADSSLRRDRGIKRELYAEAGVPEYWIIDVNASTVEIHTDPIGSTYGNVRVVRDGDILRPLQLAAIAVADLPR